MEKVKNIPQLRFPEFEGEWENKKLGRISKFSKGKGIAKADISENGKTECIRYGELYTYYNEVISEVISKTDVDKKELVLSEQNDVIIPASGESQIDIATASYVPRSGIALGGDLNIIRTNGNGIFLAYYLNNGKRNDIAKLAQGISVVHLYSSQLALLQLKIPSLPEQKRIASFLTSVDEKLTALKKKKALLEQYKKGVMQKIFSQEIRFKDEDGKEFPKWEKKKLGEFLSIPPKMKPKIIDKEKLLTVKLHLKGVLKNENTESLSIGSTIYYIRHKGQFIYGKQNLFNGAFGIIPEEFDGFLSSGDVPSLDIDYKKCNSSFLSYSLSRESFYKKLENIASGSGSKRIHEETLLNVEVVFPSLPEQTKIANFLSSIDQKISHCQQQIEQTTQWKKGLLQKMFV
ncbi:MAG: restriction endonuclease subunit S [Bacteroidales bacterium]|jgi:type I restriction enzyme S subunit|nr:restriction endonuclease subunit S [Bacteroidales bacterium]